MAAVYLPDGRGDRSTGCRGASRTGDASQTGDASFTATLADDAAVCCVQAEVAAALERVSSAMLARCAADASIFKCIWCQLPLAT